jgi:outer membrane immunogenic protein
MKKILLATSAIIALTSVASAADLATRPYTKAPAMVSPATNWSGFYIGAMGGYGWSGSVSSAGTTVSSSDLKGGFGGGTIGYNWQAPGSQTVLGLEADIAGSDLSTSDSSPGFTASDKVRSFGSVTGRLGYAFSTAMIYAKGGFAWADNQVSLAGAGVTVSDSQIHAGFTVGAGLEVMFAPNWSAKAEYMYADYGKETYFGNTDFGFTTHTIKGGLNYHFGGPAVARY